MEIETMGKCILLNLSKCHPHTGITGGNDGKGRGENNRQHTDDTQCDDQSLHALTANFNDGLTVSLFFHFIFCIADRYADHHRGDQKQYTGTCDDSIE